MTPDKPKEQGELRSKDLLAAFMVIFGIILWLPSCILVCPLYPATWPLILAVTGAIVWMLGMLIGKYRE